MDDCVLRANNRVNLLQMQMKVQVGEICGLFCYPAHLFYPIKETDCYKPPGFLQRNLHLWVISIQISSSLLYLISGIWRDS